MTLAVRHAALVGRLWRALVLGVSPAWVGVGAAVAVTGLFGTVAADLRWLAALGAYVAGRGIPDFVPYADAPSQGWPNVPVLAELAFHGLQAAGGDRAFLAAQVAAVGLAFALLALDLRRARASDPAALLVLSLLIPGAFAFLAPIRSQLFSLALFPALVALLREETRRPSRRVWLLVPLLALWSNLHGAALVGLAVAGCYLLLERARRQPLLAAAVGACSALAILATPALWRTADYYAGVLRSEPARRAAGLWAPLDLDRGLDLAFLACALLLAAAALRSRPRPWELVSLAALAALTGQAARGGVWLLFLLATPAALGLARTGTSRARLALPAAAAMVALAGVGIARGPHESAAGPGLVRRALALAAGTPVLAGEQLAEQVALAGGRIWIGNPIDAFRRSDQRLYLDWLEGRPAGDAALVRAPRVVLVRPGSEADRRLARRGALREVARDSGAVLYARPRPAATERPRTAIDRSR